MNSNSFLTPSIAKSVPVTSPESSDNPIKTTTGPVRKRARHSKLDPHFNLIAALIFQRAANKEQFNSKGLSLDAMSLLIHKKIMIKVNKSTLCRFLKKHPALNSL